MLIKPDEKYIPSLVSLWHKVFGDDEEYINLFFKNAYFHSDTFAEIIGGEVVSALYLLNADIKSGGKAYKGRYLYAAATLPEYRGKGYMAKLINEALSYAEEENLDFIALVPADDGLYGYYERFGFKEAMYKYRLHLYGGTATMRAFREISDPKEFYDIRNSYQGNMLIYDDIISEYAFECMKFAGSRVFSISDKAYYAEGEEVFFADTDSYNISEVFLRNLCGETEIFSNMPLNGAEKIRNGMVYCRNENLKNKEFYMNIALD